MVKDAEVLCRSKMRVGQGRYYVWDQCYQSEMKRGRVKSEEGRVKILKRERRL